MCSNEGYMFNLYILNHICNVQPVDPKPLTLNPTRLGSAGSRTHACTVLLLYNASYSYVTFAMTSDDLVRFKVSGHILSSFDLRRTTPFRLMNSMSHVQEKAIESLSTSS